MELGVILQVLPRVSGTAVQPVNQNAVVRVFTNVIFFIGFKKKNGIVFFNMVVLQVCYVNQEVVVPSGEDQQLLIGVILAFLPGIGVGDAALMVQEEAVHFDSDELFRYADPQF